MSVIVKGMDIPEKCFDCPINCRMPDYTLLCRLDFKPRDPFSRNDCPLVKYPSKELLEEEV